MPAVIAGAVLLPTIGLLVLLDRQPPPSTTDVAQRKARRSMTLQECRALVLSFGPGLVIYYASFGALTALRSYRDLFFDQLLTGANGGELPSSGITAVMDIPAAICASVVMVSFFRIKDSWMAIKKMLQVTVVAVALTGLVTVAFHFHLIGGVLWQMLVGIGLFVPYSLGSSVIHDRLVSTSSVSGATCVLLILIGDVSGYLFSIGLLLWKTFQKPSSHQVASQYVTIVCFVTPVLCTSYAIALGLLAWRLRRGRRRILRESAF